MYTNQFITDYETFTSDLSFLAELMFCSITLKFISLTNILNKKKIKKYIHQSLVFIIWFSNTMLI